ncbi:MAG: leucine-rich repeat protein [Tannerellaceae bacterium]|jgi:uncharacterized protein YjdB|nr:leucine-rich repeat protein [Tannerellaceae bacterium]
MKVRKVLSRFIVLAVGLGGWSAPLVSAVKVTDADIILIDVPEGEGEFQKVLTKWAEEYTPALLTHVKITGVLPADELSSLTEYFTNLAYVDLEDLKIVPKAIPSYAFADMVSLQHVIVPDSLEAIGIGAFKGCKNLQSVSFPLLLKTIGDSAFFNCSAVSGALNIPANVEYIGANAFEKCGKLTNLSLGSSLKSIGAYAFAGDTLLANELFLPSGLRVIAPGTFYKCGFTGVLRIADYVSVIQGDEFLVDETGVTQPQGKGAFEGCIGLQQIELGAGLREIGARAFFGCTGLSGIPKLPVGLSYIGPSAFGNCIRITRVELPQHLTEFGVYHNGVSGAVTGAFAGCTKLAELVIFDRIESIAPYTFYGCSNLEVVTLGKGLRAIGDSAFAACPKLNGKIWKYWNPIHLDGKVFGDAVVTFEKLSSSVQVFYVKHNGSDDTSGDNGHTWATAYRTLEKAIQEGEATSDTHVRMESMGYTATAGSVHFSQGALSLVGGYTGEEVTDQEPLGNSSSLKLTSRPEFSGKSVLIIGDPFKVTPSEVNLKKMVISGVETRSYLIGNWDQATITDVTFNNTAALTGVFTLKGKVKVQESLILSGGSVTFHDAVVSANAPICVSSLDALGTVTFNIPVWDPGVERVVLSTWGENLPDISSFRGILNGEVKVGQGFRFKWERDTRLNKKGEVIEYGRQRHLVAISYVPADELVITSPSPPYLALGASIKLNYKVSPASSTYPDVTWYSSDTSIIKIDSLTGVAVSTGNKLGSVDISAVSNFDNQLVGHYSLTVIAIKGITSSSKLIPLDSSLRIHVSTEPSGVLEGDIFTWEASDDEGKVWVKWVEDATGGGYEAYGVHSGEVTIKVAIKGNNESPSYPIEGKGTFVVTGINIENAEKDRLWINQTLKLNATVTPQVDNDYIVWASDSLHIAEIDEKTGVVTPIAPGTTIITASLSKNRAISARYTLHVTNLVITPLVTNSILTGSTLALSAKLLPKEGKDTTLVWKSSDPSIATVDPITGFVTGIRAGEISISSSLLAQPEDITCSSIFVVIQRPDISTKLSVDSSFQLPVDLLVRGIPEPMEWVSSDSGIAKIDGNFRIRGIAPGQVTLTGTLISDPSVSISCTFHVVRIAITPGRTLSLPVNIPLQLGYSVSPENAPSLGIPRWSSSDPLVARVDSVTGLVTAGIVKGYADITLTVASGDGHFSFNTIVRVTVVDPVDGLFITESRHLMAKDEQHTLNVLMYLDPKSPPIAIPERELEWFSSDPEIVSVYYGTITALKEGGPVRIYAQTADGQFTSEACEVSVMVFAKDIIFSAPTQLTRGSQYTITANVVPADATLPTIKWDIEDPSILLKINETDNTCTIQGGLMRGGTNIYIESADGRITKTHYITIYHIGDNLEETFSPEQNVTYEYGTLHLTGLEGYRCTVFALTGQSKVKFQVSDHDRYQDIDLSPGIYILYAESQVGIVSHRFVVK